jgi:hypothetical protein
MAALAVVVLLLGASAPAVAAETATGQLVISTTPAGGVITVDGNALGKAPITARNLLPGDHVVEASWPDGRTATILQHVDAGASLDVQVLAPAAPTPQPVGNLVIVSDPTGAELIIDGSMLGKAPMTAKDLVVGEHRVQARWPSGQMTIGTAKVSAGASAVLMLHAPAPKPGAAAAAPAPAAPAAGNPQAATPPAATPPAATPPADATPSPTSDEPDAAAAATADPNAAATTTAPGATSAAASATSVAPGAADLSATAAGPPKKTPVYKKWWLWTIVGVAVVGVTVGLAVGLSGGNSRYSIAEF